MICPICKNGTTIKGSTTLVFEKGKSTIIVKNVPAEICDNCSESYVSEKVARKVLDYAHRGVRSGIEIEILNYAA